MLRHTKQQKTLEILIQYAGLNQLAPGSMVLHNNRFKVNQINSSCSIRPSAENQPSSPRQPPSIKPLPLLLGALPIRSATARDLPPSPSGHSASRSEASRSGHRLARNRFSPRRHPRRYPIGTSALCCGWPAQPVQLIGWGPGALVIRPPFFLSISVFLLFGLVSFLS